MAKFRTKPFQIEATQWFKDGDHRSVGRYRQPDPFDMPCGHCDAMMSEHGCIETMQGEHNVCPGDWIISEPDRNGFYPCKPLIFAAKYEPVE